MTHTRTIRHGEAVLHLEIEGPEGLPWLIASNSLATDLSMWDDQMATLVQRRRVVRYDTRGHGRSSAPDGPYSFEMLVGDMVAVLDALDIQEVDILGLSLGGMTALGTALQHPTRVRSLVCAQARGMFPPAGIEMWDQRAAAVRDGGMAAVVDDTLSRWFMPETHENRPQVIDKARRMILGTSAGGYISCTAALKQLDYLRRLGNIAKPVLYIAGELDGGAPVAAMREMADATPGSRFEVISGAAHIGNMEKPSAYNRLLGDFLQ